MKRAVFLFSVFLCFLPGGYPQKVTGPFISKPVYSDLSPSLSSLVAPLTVRKESRKAEKTEREIWNYFQRNLKRNKSGKNQADPYRQAYFGKIKPDSALLNFEGTANVNTAIPPDTYGDVGSSCYFHMVNLSFTIFDKSGNTLLGPSNTGTIWSGLPYSQNSGDAIVLYDDQAQRWFVSALCMPAYPSPPYFVMIAVSQTPDPTGAWYRWEYPFDGIPDYPKFGIWRDAYFMSVNRFTAKSSFNGIGAVAFDRAGMLAGASSPDMVLFKVSHTLIGSPILPADCDGNFAATGTPGYFAYPGPSYLGIYEFHTDWENPENATFGNLNKISICSYDPNVGGIVQKGSPVKLDPISDRLMCRLQFRKFTDHQSMVVNHTIKSGNSHAGIRWYELRRTAGDWSVYQQSTYAPDTNSRWMGSIAMDSAGNIALGFSVSGNDLYPSIRYTGRMKHDPPGQMTIAEQSIVEGGGAQTHPATTVARWGDYSSMTVDPSNQSIFWYTQQYYPVTADYDWHTRVGSFTFSDILSVAAVAAFPDICRGQTDQLDVDVSGGTGSYTYSWTSLPVGFVSSLKNPVVFPEVSTTYIVVVTSGNQTRTDSIQIGIIPLPEVFAGEDTVCCRYTGEIHLHGSAENYISVKWTTTGDGTFKDPFTLSTTYTPGSNDRADSIIDLELMVYPQPPCPVISDHKLIRMDTCSGIPSILPDNSMNIFPNPGTGIFTISLPVNSLLIEISDLPGKRIFSTDLSSRKEKEFIVDLSDKPRGMYPVRIILKDRIICDKLIIW
jgi:hypothetical protein